MDHHSTETLTSDSGDETSSDGEQMTLEEADKVRDYVRENPNSPNTQLFSFLVLLNTYVPGSFLLMSECQQILGPPDPIHGGPPFEERMEPFISFINISSPNPDRMCHIKPLLTTEALQLLTDSGISRSNIVKKFMDLLCRDEAQPTTVEFIKDLLTKREMGENGKEKFSPLVLDICEQENSYNAISVLKTASNIMTQNHIYPQTLSRFYYIKRGIYDRAETWAKIAISRAQNNSHVADTLGQVYKNRLLRTANQLEEILDMAREALTVFKDVGTKADNEEGTEMIDSAGSVNISKTFNDRGLFGFLQVANIAFEKLQKINRDPRWTHLHNLEMEVEAKFGFFEWYLGYSKPDETTSEPPYFWKDVALCYKHYTRKDAAHSTSFPGLLERLNHGLFTSMGRRAGFLEAQETTSDLEAICDDLKTTHETDVGDVEAAGRYILSNIILSNKKHNSSKLTPVNELKTVLFGFLDTEVGRRSPEFYLLVLLLFWPEEHPQLVEEEDEEVKQPATEDNGSENETWEDEDRNEQQESEGEPAQLSLDVIGPDLQQHITFMEKAFERDGYAKYLRGRYLVPLFFLGKGSGLSKWIHKSRLDAIVERQVDAELADSRHNRTKEKWNRINDLWSKGNVWQVPEIQDILLPVRTELTPPQETGQQMSVFLRGIWVTTEFESHASAHRRSYLGLTIQGPVVLGEGGDVQM
ncbi:sterile alpha motif domain-containing protein 9-like [Labrus mixtus]|uniref:sterile alpha motif domain-containing protein 9-like n=1 Tax=Labrus mixtus TaxID=508554 RepID=UPI0029BFD8BC|nr:sterile alpha motif domain-containing protein 9-like [Labrus mixtus]